MSKLDDEVSKTQVLIFAGGEGKRMGIRQPKALLELNGRALIDRCISFFNNCGYREFVLLLGYAHEQIIEHLSNLKLDIDMRLSVDPVIGFGRGRSFKFAIENDKIDKGKRCIVTFPDDVFTDKLLPIRILSEHLNGVNSFGTIASLVLTRGRVWPYGVAEVDELGLIRSFNEKPFIERPTSVGNYIFEPDVYELIINEISMDDDNKKEIESTIIPLLASKKKLYSIFIQPDSWFPINTMKDFEEAERLLRVKDNS